MLRETQTLHAGCSKVEPKILAPTADPFPGVRRNFQVIVVTDPQTNKPTDMTDYNTLHL